MQAWEQKWCCNWRVSTSRSSRGDEAHSFMRWLDNASRVPDAKRPNVISRGCRPTERSGKNVRPRRGRICFITKPWAIAHGYTRFAPSGQPGALSIRAFIKRLTQLALTLFLILSGDSTSGAEPSTSWTVLAPFFQPPAEFVGQFGGYRSSLLFADGSRVRTAQDWLQRREEIRQQWMELMGPWPPVIEKPKLEFLAQSRRENFTQHRVRLQIAPQQTGDGWLLVPDGKGPFPAVLVVFYEPETSVGLSTNQFRDFGYQLARRGFVTLNIGTPGGNAWKPEIGAAQCQPLSFHAYVAANCWQALANLPQVDPKRIGVVGHSYGGKWAMFAAALWEKFACVAVSDPGIVFDETRSNVNYWEPWYLGLDEVEKRPKAGIPSAENTRTGAYKRMVDQGRDLHELHALIAPRPFFVSGGAEDPPSRWTALNHLVEVNRILGSTNRVAMTNRREHSPNFDSNEQIYAFFSHFLGATRSAVSGAGDADSRSSSGRLRVIIETDAGGDPDDEQSLVRFLLYANEWDVEGIIANRPEARRGENRNSERTGLGIVRRLINAYGQCFTNLVQHDARFPSPETLNQKAVAGYNSTDEAMNLIIAAVDDPDPRPVWYSDWGTDNGAATNNLKRALDKVLLERGQEGYAKFKSRLCLSSSEKFGAHTKDIAPPFPFWVDTWRPELNRLRWYHRFSALTSKAGGFDIERDVRQNHGPLGALYPTNTTHWCKEGDTASFLYLVPNGLGDPMQPGWGNWAGRYGSNETYAGLPYFWANQIDAWNGTTNRDNTLRRWAVQLQNDFKVRLDWCVNGFESANHPPQPRVRGLLNRTALPGETVELDASESIDPDGHALKFEWIHYAEAGPYRGDAIMIAGAATPQASFVMPTTAAGQSIHVILMVTDSGMPALTRYQRVIVTAGKL